MNITAHTMSETHKLNYYGFNFVSAFCCFSDQLNRNKTETLAVTAEFIYRVNKINRRERVKK